MRQTLIIKPTHNCNLNCWFCYDRHERYDHPLAVMPVDKFIQAIEKWIKETPNCAHSVIVHGGEPLTVGKGYFKTFNEALKDYNIEWHIQTNLSLMDQEWADLLRKYKYHIGASWDGLKCQQPQSHNSQYIENALRYLRPGEFGLLFVITPQNVDDVLDSYIWAWQRGLGISFSTIFGEKLTEEDYNKIILAYDLLFDYLCKNRDSNPSFRPFDEYLDYIQGIFPRLCEHGICANGWRGIDYNGDVSQCGKPWEEKDMVYGNVFDENFHFYNMDKNRKFIKFKQNEVDQFSQCKDCKWLILCNDDCPFQNYDAQGNYHFDENYCYFKKELLDSFDEILLMNLEQKTLSNRTIIDDIYNTERIDFFKYRNYEYEGDE